MDEVQDEERNPADAGVGNKLKHSYWSDFGEEWHKFWTPARVAVRGGVAGFISGVVLTIVCLPGNPHTYNTGEPENTILSADNPLCVERYHPSGSVRTCTYEKNTRLRVEFYDPGGELQRQSTIDALMTDDSVQEYVKQYIKDSSLLRNAGLMR
ncbi:hypothetical protein HZB90_03255 [archaeon]|nr:hypothetical protein [archaeon]